MPGGETTVKARNIKAVADAQFNQAAANGERSAAVSTRSDTRNQRWVLS